MENSDFNVVSIQDTLLAGMYSSGYSNLETVNKELYVSVSSWNKIFAKINSSDDNINKTLLIALCQSLINFNKKILYICNNKENAIELNNTFTKVLKFVDGITSGYNTNNTHIIFSCCDEIDTFDNIGYVVLDNSISVELVSKLNYTVNYAIFIQNNLSEDVAKLVKQLNSLENDIFIKNNENDENIDSNLAKTILLAQEAGDYATIDTASEEEVVEEEVVVEEGEEVVVVEEGEEVVVVEEGEEEVVVEEGEVVVNDEEGTSSESSCDSIDLSELLGSLSFNLPKLNKKPVKKGISRKDRLLLHLKNRR